MEESVREQWLILWTTPVYVLVILAEILLSNWQNRDTYSVKDTVNNFLFMLLNGGIDLDFPKWFFRGERASEKKGGRNDDEAERPTR